MKSSSNPERSLTVRGNLMGILLASLFAMSVSAQTYDCTRVVRAWKAMGQTTNILEASATQCCTMDGVKCGNDGTTVVEVVWRMKLLKGPISSWLSNLINLQTLDLGLNDLNGTIPDTLGNLTKLQKLDLGTNLLSGKIPDTLGKLTKLTELTLGLNYLSGSIPTTLGNMTNLQKLALGQNKLNGSIPTTLGKLTNLQNLGLNNNELSGSIPTTLGNMTKLQWLLVYGNKLTGQIPAAIGSLTNLTKFFLYANPNLNGIFDSNTTGLTVVATGTKVTVCGKPASISPPTGMGTSCSGTVSLSKRAQAFSIAVDEKGLRYCNTDASGNPNQDCFNSLTDLCNSTYIKGYSIRIGKCKDAVKLAFDASLYWTNYRNHCARWISGGDPLSSNCQTSTNQLITYASYYIPELGTTRINSNLTESVKKFLWNNTAITIV